MSEDKPLQTTGAITAKRYKCVDCGHEHTASTNHYGEIYIRCTKCSWKPGQGMRHECLEPLPEGWGRPEPWKLVKLGDVAEITTVKPIRKQER